ncbi:hypothetical protein [Catellatospora bangladeshensis]|uniref:Ankyrin repeat domain-containing protein n=2 Tax=Catellatospora bangladeshensis TaxID=310355 RepID=A0A8J3JN07_9ACTN|nr:hypothetical protein [Catellatospora bangladeshensis]GIF85424.1 hypothetical protein Cba03nite_67730 [Catellatospora bangladeshensis]
MITSLRDDLAQWRRIRARMPSPGAVAAAARARAAGDWRTAAAVVPADLELDLAAVRDRHGAEAAARIADDLRHLALDLLVWHLPRHPGGMTTYRARTSAVLVPDTVEPDAPLLRVRLPLSPTGPQRLRLTVATVAEMADHRWYVAPRHTWDVRATAGLRAAWGCSAERPPLLRPDGTPLPWSELGRGADEAAATERIYLMLAAGEYAAAWRACGFDIPFTETKPLQADTAPPTCPVGLAAELRAAAAAFGTTQASTQFGAHVDVTVAETLTAAAGDAHDFYDLYPRVASGPVPADLALLYTGRLTPDDLHPLLREALLPARPGAATPESPAAATAADSTTTTNPPHVGAHDARTLHEETRRAGRRRGQPGDPARIRCQGAWHVLGVREGALRLDDHTDEELRREQTLRAMGGASAGCFAAREAWLTGAGRLPRALVAQRALIRERMLDGDTDWLLDGLARGVIDPHMRDGSGWSLRHTAMWVDHERLLPLLDAAGVPVDARDRAGRTPLYVAVMNGGDVSLIHRLLAAGADPFAETVHGAMVASSAAYRARRDDLDFLTKLLHERWAALRG